MKSYATIYSGTRLHDITGRSIGVLVTVNDQLLKPRPTREEAEYHTRRFDWGSFSRESLQLARAILLDFTRDHDVATGMARDFVYEHVARWGDQWSINGERILEFLHPQRVAWAPRRVLARAV